MECNICLGEKVRSPVVTCCGHLFCWPCIYSWLHIQQQQQNNSAPRQVQEGSCPVCKGALSLVAGSNDLIPIYSSTSSQDAAEDQIENTHEGRPLPPRPTAARREAAATAANMQPQHHHRGQDQEYDDIAEMEDQLHAVLFPREINFMDAPGTDIQRMAQSAQGAGAEDVQDQGGSRGELSGELYSVSFPPEIVDAMDLSGAENTAKSRVEGGTEGDQSAGMPGELHLTLSGTQMDEDMLLSARVRYVAEQERLYVGDEGVTMEEVDHRTELLIARLMGADHHPADHADNHPADYAEGYNYFEVRRSANNIIAGVVPLQPTYYYNTEAPRLSYMQVQPSEEYVEVGRSTNAWNGRGYNDIADGVPLQPNSYYYTDAARPSNMHIQPAEDYSILAWPFNTRHSLQ